MMGAADLDDARGLLLMEALADQLVIDTAYGTRVRLTRRIGQFAVDA